ncbi:MAG: radical SAM protein [archaeon]
MKVVLMSSWSNIDSTSLPLGIGYIASVLKQNGFQVDYIDRTLITEDDKIVERLNELKPDVVGVAIMTPTFSAGKKMTALARKCVAKPLVVVGGPHPTVWPEKCLEDKNVDIAVIAEGEYTMLELMQALRDKKTLQGIKGIFYKDKNGKIIKNLPRPFIDNIDELPFPDFKLLNVDFYSKLIGDFPTIIPQTMVMAGRGCPFNCSYCQPTGEKLAGRKLRIRSPKNLVDELEWLKNTYGFTSFKLGCDTLTVNKKWVKDFADEMVQRKLNIIFLICTRVDCVDEQVIKDLKRAGCFWVIFGTESGSQRVLNEIMHKGATVEQAREAFKLCKKYKLLAGANIMIGTPGETLEDVKQTIKLVQEIKPDTCAEYVTCPFPGTHLYDNALKNNLLLEFDPDNSRLFDRHRGGLIKRDLSDEQIMFFTRFIWMEVKKQKLSYYLMPWKKPYYLRVVAKRNWCTLRYDFKVFFKFLGLAAKLPFVLAKFYFLELPKKKHLFNQQIKSTT